MAIHSMNQDNEFKRGSGRAAPPDGMSEGRPLGCLKSPSLQEGVMGMVLFLKGLFLRNEPIFTPKFILYLQQNKLLSHNVIYFQRESERNNTTKSSISSRGSGRESPS